MLSLHKITLPFDKQNIFFKFRLNITILYKLFLEYHKNNLNNELSICHKTFRNYFYKNFNYGFRKPRVDQCDLCYKIQHLRLENVEQKDKL